jgi:hypothetical protein
MRVRRIPVSALRNAGHACGWEGCARSFKGDMPKGWVWLLTYWSPQASLDDLLANLKYDYALCPEHVALLGAHLKFATAINERLSAPQRQA